MSIILKLKVQKGLPVRRGYDHYWSVIMDLDHLGQPVSVDAIFAKSSAGRDEIRAFVRKLEKAGVLTPYPFNGGYKVLLRQSSTPRIHRNGSLIESQPPRRCMWNYMRGPLARNGFCTRDLVNWSQTDETRITMDSAKAYVSNLFDAGYLILLAAGKRGSPAYYRLDPKMIKGPEAPMVLRSQFVYDPNNQEIYGDATAEEVVA
ncbi:hypothetical protein [Agrobacterium vitis]|uniref:hypothetical protein n=1 Tax=Agrobacterium vitis TaxID=373 RepID=UPI0015777439|nr:hypothetical protein G6L01_020985 [Agrobacterium vitis]